MGLGCPWLCPPQPHPVPLLATPQLSSQGILGRREVLRLTTPSEGRQRVWGSMDQEKKTTEAWPPHCQSTLTLLGKLAGLESPDDWSSRKETRTYCLALGASTWVPIPPATGKLLPPCQSCPRILPRPLETKVKMKRRKGEANLPVQSGGEEAGQPLGGELSCTGA